MFVSDKLEDKYIFHHLVFSDSTVWITLLEWTPWRKDGHGMYLSNADVYTAWT